jgi:hypothetical protein
MSEIYRLIPLVMAEVPEIPKARRHSQGWAYRGFDDFLTAFRPALQKHGLFIVPEVLGTETSEKKTSNNASMSHVIVTVAYSVFAPDGSMIRSVVIGESWDTSDNASTKALDDAFTSFLTQVFCVPTGEKIGDNGREGNRRDNSNGTQGKAGKAPAPPPPPAPPVPVKAEKDPLPPPSNNLTEKDLNDRADRFVKGNMVSRIEGGYRVTVNPRFSYAVTKDGKRTVCECERFLAMRAGNPEFRCEHIRAVAVYYQAQLDAVKQADKSLPATATFERTQNQLAIDGLIVALSNRGVSAAEITGRIARLTDGKTGVDDLDPAEAAKVLAAFNNWLADVESKAPLKKGA